MLRILTIVAVLLFAISRATSEPKVRKAHHKRKHLAGGPGKKVADTLQIVEHMGRPQFMDNMHSIETTLAGDIKKEHPRRRDGGWSDES